LIKNIASGTRKTLIRSIAIWAILGTGSPAFEYTAEENQQQKSEGHRKPNNVMKNSKKSEVLQVVVIGTSAGGLHALTDLLSQLRQDFPAPVLVVQHISADATGNVLLDALKRTTKLNCRHASSKTILEPGHLYLAPSDHHLSRPDFTCRF
jgi:chemotaxis response regulator CheB